MRRYLTSTFVAVGCASMLSITAGAQSQETKTTVKTEHAKTVSYTGCVQSGTETRTFVLNHVVPVTTTKTTGTSGTMTTTTEYVLVPEGTVTLQEHVGHKVQVEGVLIPAGKGDAKIETRKKTDGDTTERTKTEVARGPMQQLRVISVKPLAEPCS